MHRILIIIHAFQRHKQQRPIFIATAHVHSAECAMSVRDAEHQKLASAQIQPYGINTDQ